MMMQNGQAQTNTSLRLGILGAILMIVVGILLGRLWFVQVIENEKFALKAEGNCIRTLFVEAPRGRIFDRYGRLLVGNKLCLAIFVSPADCDDRAKLVKNLAKVLGKTEEQIDARLKNRKYSMYFPKVIEEDASIAVVTAIKEHPKDFPGVFIEARPSRYYPYGSLASHLIGYVGRITEDELDTIRYQDYMAQDIIGQSGVEYQYDSYLQGVKGVEYLEVDALGIPLKVMQKEEPQTGADLYLTIDLDIQKRAESALVNAINRARNGMHKNAEAGAIVVLDVKNGDVLAMASYPTFDPDIFIGGISQSNWEFINDPANLNPLQPRAFGSSYPPGSSFKPVAGVGALAEGIVDSQTTFNCGGMWYGFGSSWAKACWKKGGHGHIPFDDAIVYSCDIAFYNIGLLYYRLPGEKLQQWARELGLGAPTGIDLPFEDLGRVPDKAWKASFYKGKPDYAAWVPGDTVNMVIGQGDLLVTPLQLANAYASIANGGNLYAPKVLKKIEDSSRRPGISGQDKLIRKLPVSGAQLGQIRGDLLRVTTSGTAAGSFWDFPIQVAGKTGTAEVTGKDDQSWFVAFAPANDPQYVVLATIEQGGHGSTTAAPAVKDVLAQIFDIELDENLMYKAEPGQAIEDGGD